MNPTTDYCLIVTPTIGDCFVVNPTLISSLTIGVCLMVSLVAGDCLVVISIALGHQGMPTVHGYPVVRPASGRVFVLNSTSGVFLVAGE